MRFIYYLGVLVVVGVCHLNAETSCDLPRKRPNILILLVDELRAPVVYETPELIQWLKENLPTMTFLRENGVNFKNHYSGSTACAPSRATFFTGQYPTLHGVSQTDGAAKPAADPTMFWLSPNTVPTAGNIFSEGRYATYYIGKWHISRDDLYDPGTQEPVLSYNQTTGVPDAHLENIYRSANMLKAYGFGNGWIGPEPHGSSPHQSGGSAAIGVSGRDIYYADKTVALLNQLSAEADTLKEPWFLVCSFVNPHDIALYGDTTKNFPTFNFEIDPTLPKIPPAPTAKENLSTKPSAQKSYQTQYQLAFQPTTDTDEYRSLYYTLQKKVDKQMSRVLEALLKSAFSNNTIVVFTSDHGDLLGAHANFQKWFNMYEESIHVPLIFYSPTLLPQGVNVELITSHVDILPTLSGLAGIDADAILDKFHATYTNSRQLVGRDLSKIVAGTATACEVKTLQEPILFVTYDQIFTGADMTNPTGVPYNYVNQPAFINAIITQMNGQIWKLAKYYENREFAHAPLSCSCSTPLATPPPPAEYEMYNLTNDPTEITNLPLDPTMKGTLEQLLQILHQQMHQKALRPKNSRPNFPLLPRPG